MNALVDVLHTIVDKVIGRFHSEQEMVDLRNMIDNLKEDAEEGVTTLAEDALGGKHAGDPASGESSEAS